MKPSARINETISLLRALSKSKVPMDSTIGDYMRPKRYIGSKDRADIVERVYNIVRAQARLGWWINTVMINDNARNRIILWLMLEEIKNAKEVTELFDGSKYGPKKLSADEFSLCKHIKSFSLLDKKMPDSVKVECPSEHEETLKDYFGKDFVQEMQALMVSAPLDIRVNTLRAKREEVKQTLEKERVLLEKTPFSDWGLRAKEKIFLSKTSSFRNGDIEIQDEGSQLIASICEVHPGMQVLDFCAGGGGKSLALAMEMKIKGRLVALDIDEKRLLRSKSRFKRAGVADIIEVRPLTEEKNRKWLRRQKETFDVVLADVPCSGSGTWRRNPDVKWRQFGPSLEELLTTQKEILEKAAKAVKKQGRLVYATCSLFPKENEEQIEWFLKNHSDFKVLPIQNKELGQDYLRLTPYRHKTDGFFGAILQRQN